MWLVVQLIIIGVMIGMISHVIMDNHIVTILMLQVLHNGTRINLESWMCFTPTFPYQLF